MKFLFAAAAAIVAIVPAAASAQTAKGLHIEARVGYESIEANGTGGLPDLDSLDGLTYGGGIGYDFKLTDSITVGPYAVFELSESKECVGGGCIEIENSLDLGGRVGFGVGSKATIFAKVAYARLSATDGIDNESKDGIAGSLGVEYSLGNSTFIFVDATFADYGKLAGFRIQRKHAGAGIGVRF